MLLRAQKALDKAILWQELCREVHERLALIKRDFHHGLLVRDLTFTSPNGLLGKFQQTSYDQAHHHFASGQTYDAIVACGVLHMIDNASGFLQLCHAHLKPDGLFLATFWGGDSLIALRRAFLDADSKHYQGAKLRIAPMIPLQSAAALIHQAGFALPVADFDRVRIPFHTIFQLLRALQSSGLGNAMSSPQRLRRQYLADVETAYRHLSPDLTLELDMISLIGWKPSASQPQALKRGSAQTSLAEALTKFGA